MKNNSYLQNKIVRAMPVALLLLAGGETFSQSTALPSEKAVIILKDGQQIENVTLWQLRAKVLEYELNGNLHDALLADIERIRMPETDYFFNANDSLEKTSPEISLAIDSSQTKIEKDIPVLAYVSVKNNYEQGYHDAIQYYNGTGAAIGGFVSGMVPVLGWFVTMPVIAATKPQMYNSDNPNVGKLHDKDYIAGYKKKASNKKLGNTLGGFGLGLVTFLAMIL